MAEPKKVLELAGHEVAISNPSKVFFPRAGVTKLDMVRYYLAVAPGALGGVRGRPMALKRFVNGAEAEPFFQKRAPEKRPDFIATVELSVPSGRTADEVVVTDEAALAWVINLGCIDLNPHPVRGKYTLSGWEICTRRPTTSITIFLSAINSHPGPFRLTALV